MNYYYDTEFLEGTQDKRFIGFKYGNTSPTIDLISIGIVSEDGREYYAISKDFNIKEAWNRYDLVWEQTSGDMRNHFPNGITKKVYWIRENVLKPIFKEWKSDINGKIVRLGLPVALNEDQFNYRNFKNCIKSIGKSNKQIADEVFEFISGDALNLEKAKHYNVEYENIDLYGYYSAYDHVALCWLFGKMIDLPKGFPMYTIDLKQMLDEKENSLKNEYGTIELVSEIISEHGCAMVGSFKSIKDFDTYPKQENEHNALADARWNKKLHEFLIQVT